MDDLAVYEKYKEKGFELPQFALNIRRNDIYTRIDDKLISLNDIGNDINE